MTNKIENWVDGAPTETGLHAVQYKIDYKSELIATVTACVYVEAIYEEDDEVGMMLHGDNDIEIVKVDRFIKHAKIEL